MILSFKIISWVVFDVVALCSDDASWSHWHSMLHVQEHGAFESRFSRPILKSVDLAPSHISALFFCDTVKKSISQLICCEKEASEFCGSIWGKDEKMQFFEPRGQKRKASAKDLGREGGQASNHQILRQSRCSSFETPKPISFLYGSF